ncbi:hypothetical protein BST95_10345 [Halioglobus japonicus]|uniref:Nuclear transport factor 2 family protein n=1 Tax=Halioglobus japonicus TaxID=930805 RepID=A0AAP8SNG3_9GAMM|nr:nuclear transport factor 2 family protein [Halioglobus japonicus]AQA18573.1 hypothetical protein BST95_10345 [Halioglobus japonicus]PLW86597.1 nuclear transport factor 2 family protein [Halioglobus japonicus]GHD12053.1 bile-acid 7-alpha-dehydratase [Halioglobus japonicus]
MSEHITRLLAIEEIKALKAKYFRCLDTKDWEGLGECFCDDLDADFTAAPGPHTSSRAEYLAMIQKALKYAETVHYGHMPEITVLDASAARGVWAMQDMVKMPAMTLTGFGHYHEEYRLEDGQWRISRILLTRLMLDMEERSA